MAETATYIDENGQRKQGTVQQPQQPAQPQGTQQGDYYDQAAQQYRNLYDSQQQGRNAYYDRTAQQYQQMYDQLGQQSRDYYDQAAARYQDLYDRMQQAQDAEAAAAIERSQAEIQRQQGRLNEEYGQTNRQLYQDYMNARRTLPQRLAAQGMTGGLAESSNVQLESGYGENLGANERARLNALADLAAQGEQERYAAESAARQGKLAAMQDYYNSLNAAEAGRYSDTRSDTASLYAQLAALEGNRYSEGQGAEKELYAQLAALEQGRYGEGQQQRQNQAELLASMGDFSGYVEMGLLTPAQAAQMQKAWIAENPQLAASLGYVKGGGGGRGSGKTEENTALTDQQNAYWRAADLAGRQAVAEALNAQPAYLNDQANWSDAAWAAYQNGAIEHLQRDLSYQDPAKGYVDTRQNNVIRDLNTVMNYFMEE